MGARARTELLALIAGASAGTVLVAVVDSLRFAYASHDAHLVLETSATIVAALAATLVYGRVRQTQQRSDFLLFVGLGLLAMSNFGRLLAPNFEGGNPLAIWLPLTARLLAATALAMAAFWPNGRIRSRASPLAYLAAVALAAAAVVAFVALLGPSTGIEEGFDPEDSSKPQVVGSAALIAAQLAVLTLFAAAAWGFARRAWRTGQELLTWLAAAMVLSAFARVHFLLFPSVYSDWIFTGDVLFMLSYLVILVGVLREVVANQRAATAAAVLEERTRLARDLHDGLAQDLAYLSLQAERLSGREAAAEDIARVARDALVESRGVIAGLRLTDAPLGDAIASLARALAARHDLDLTLNVDEALDGRLAERDQLLRIVSEAMANAARHGQGSRIAVELERTPRQGLRLRVTDNGSGFDTDAVGQDGHGLRGMRERVERLGGTLCVRSHSGAGTTVEVQL